MESKKESKLTTMYIYQTLIGVWPFEGTFIPELTERVKNYLLKSMKESKLRTTYPILPFYKFYFILLQIL